MGPGVHKRGTQTSAVACDMMVLMDEEPAFSNESMPWAVPREFEAGGARWLTEAARALSKELHPLLAEIPSMQINDIPASNDAESMPEEASPLFRPATISHEWTASLEEAVEFDRERFLASLHGLADAIGSQSVRHLVSFMSDTAKAHNNTIEANGRDFYEAFAEAVEKVEMVFDDEGKSDMMLMINPAFARKLRDRPPTEEQQERIDAIINRRREEWIAARRRRELP